MYVLWRTVIKKTTVTLITQTECFHTVTLYSVELDDSQEARRCFLFVLTCYVFQEKHTSDNARAKIQHCFWWCSNNTPQRCVLCYYA